MKPRSSTFRHSRREFLRDAALCSIVAPHVLGLRGATPPSERLNLAFVGVGGRGRANLNGLRGHNFVAFCDVDENRAAEGRQRYPHGRFFRDYRQMYDAVHREIDAVVVSTPDHGHAAAGLAAIDLGKHLYCEKPLAHSLHEVREMTEAARRKGVITQLGNQGHSFDSIRDFVEMVHSGAIGTVAEVHAFCQNSYQPRDHRVRPADRPKPPETLDWDLWLGPAPHRPYHPVYLPGRWRGWVDFGTGITGDWVCHVLDPVFWALDLGAPSTVVAEPLDYTDPKVRAETYPAGCVLRYQFPARGRRPAVKLTWYEGAWPPPRPEALDPKRSLPKIGAVVVGDRGTILYGSHGAAGAQLLPAERMAAYQRPAQTIPRVQGHHEDWVDAIKSGRMAGSHFGYGGPLTEIALLGVLALRFPGKSLAWDSAGLRVTNLREASKLVKPRFRTGWGL